MLLEKAATMAEKKAKKLLPHFEFTTLSAEAYNTKQCPPLTN